ncbi:MAG: ASCH domain-containing protein [Pseudorhizobium pelagicum]|uniref:ASCH domain-containing protein n=1 Tax=Pseudorhizobium pelagicum TaxID=1509405 RepID=UPI00345F6DC0
MTDIMLPTLALSIRQPWAHAIVMGRKDIENHKWTTKLRGPICIHASAYNKRNYETDREDYLDVLHGYVHPVSVPPVEMSMIQQPDFGAIVGTATIVDVVARHDSPWFFGPFGIVLADQKPLEKPIPLKGALGFFEWRKRLPETMEDVQQDQLGRPRFESAGTQGNLFG